jgi:hypothetical protein
MSSGPGTVIVEAGDAVARLAAKLDRAMAGPAAVGHRVMIACRRGEEGTIRDRLPDRFRALPVTAVDGWRDHLPIETAQVAFLPAEAAFSPPPWDAIPQSGMVLRPLVVPCPSEIAVPSINLEPTTAWAAPTALLREVLRQPPDRLTLFAVEASLARRGIALGFLSAPAFAASVEPLPPGDGTPRLRRDAAVLAVVPHYRCEAWLAQCLRSLLRQTRPPQAIVVLDDASPSPPVDLVAGFPGVTLLAAGCNVGPYRLLQTVIEQTRFDAYMLQDADDWSSDDRLERLLDGAERTGAELVGCQELRFDERDERVTTCFYPPDAGKSLRTSHTQALLHPSTLVSRDLVMRTGGFASGLRFGGDLEFQLRAHHRGLVVNIRRCCYFRRRRPDSLWTSAETGRDSAARQEQEAAIEAQAIANTERAALGQAPNLEPYRRGDPVKLDHLAGPPLP